MDEQTLFDLLKIRVYTTLPVSTDEEIDAVDEKVEALRERLEVFIKSQNTNELWLELQPE